MCGRGCYIMELGMPWSVGSMAEQTKRLEQGGSPRTSGHRRYCDFVQYRYADIGAAAPREVRAGGRDKPTGTGVTYAAEERRRRRQILPPRLSVGIWNSQKDQRTQREL